MSDTEPGSSAAAATSAAAAASFLSMRCSRASLRFIFMVSILFQFNVAGFSELELHLPAEPISATSQVPQMVASFELDGQTNGQLRILLCACQNLRNG